MRRLEQLGPFDSLGDTTTADILPGVLLAIVWANLIVLSAVGVGAMAPIQQHIMSRTMIFVFCTATMYVATAEIILRRGLRKRLILCLLAPVAAAIITGSKFSMLLSLHPVLAVLLLLKQKQKATRMDVLLFQVFLLVVVLVLCTLLLSASVDMFRAQHSTKMLASRDLEKDVVLSLRDIADGRFAVCKKGGGCRFGVGMVAATAVLFWLKWIVFAGTLHFAAVVGEMLASHAVPPWLRSAVDLFPCASGLPVFLVLYCWTILGIDPEGAQHRSGNTVLATLCLALGAGTIVLLGYNAFGWFRQRKASSND